MCKHCSCQRLAYDHHSSRGCWAALITFRVIYISLPLEQANSPTPFYSKPSKNNCLIATVIQHAAKWKSKKAVHWFLEPNTRFTHKLLSKSQFYLREVEVCLRTSPGSRDLPNHTVLSDRKTLVHGCVCHVSVQSGRHIVIIILQNGVIPFSGCDFPPLDILQVH